MINDWAAFSLRRASEPASRSKSQFELFSSVLVTQCAQTFYHSRIIGISFLNDT